MKKLVLYGDGFLCPPGGYGESLIDLLVMRRPEAAFTASLPGEENLTVEASARDLPLLVGKAPDFVYLALGTADILRGADPEETFLTLESRIQVLLQKTRARLAVATLCEAFLPPDARPAAAEFNFSLARLIDDRVGITDLNAPVQVFFERHRRGSGEKRSLYDGAGEGAAGGSLPRLTSMGRVFLSHAAYGQLDLEGLFPE